MNKNVKVKNKLMSVISQVQTHGHEMNAVQWIKR